MPSSGMFIEVRIITSTTMAALGTLGRARLIMEINILCIENTEHFIINGTFV